MKKKYSVVIVGAGPSGLGVGLCLREIGVKDYVIIERDSVGASFKKWPRETRFITPSFTSNIFGLPDLNAISPLTSPALTLQTEHPSGIEYARYLQAIQTEYNLPIKTEVEVIRIEKNNSSYTIKTNHGDIEAQYVVFAAGEFFYPKTNIFIGSEHTTHTATISAYKDLVGDEFTIIGGYESGVDATCALLSYGKKVTLINSTDRSAKTSQDPSLDLSPRSKDRLRALSGNSLFHKQFGSPVAKVKKNNDHTYQIELTNGDLLHSRTKPLLAAGFVTSSILINNLIKRDEKGNVVLNPINDEVIGSKNLFLSGPMVHHADTIFCFIYKNRQRYAVIASTIATRLGHDAKELINHYRKYQMYLDDLSCCEGTCGC